MNKKILTAMTAGFLSCFVSLAWAERPSGDATCEFPGGAYYKSNNTMYLESLNDEDARVVISNETVQCMNTNAQGDFNLVVQRNTKLAANSTIVLPVRYASKNNCVKLYEVVNFSTDDEGNWGVTAKHLKGDGDANKPMLLLTDTDREECQDIKEIEFKASNLQSTEHAITYVWLYNDKTHDNDWSFEGTYSYVRWEKDNADLGTIYGYAAKNKGKVEAGHFARLGTGAYVPPLRAYLKYIGKTPLKKSVESIVELPETIDVTLIEDEGTTRIVRLNTVTGEIKKMNGVYDLKGRKLNSKPQNKGMFIGNTDIQK